MALEEQKRIEENKIKIINNEMQRLMDKQMVIMKFQKQMKDEYRKAQLILIFTRIKLIKLEEQNK